ncbi:hypothetical protein WICPIJ_003910 [Wickerhamomyces pijperi]|uniref:Uncharacterized protein n=1 Tax=Wickerhamomyces pijperi TaxID=599730 RepID=A0A9P8TML2_WICPI|nr:hypothetical protein WICPIJ_003910 [Wickerhamomyces pijperi]
MSQVDDGGGNRSKIIPIPEINGFKPSETPLSRKLQSILSREMRAVNQVAVDDTNKGIDTEEDQVDEEEDTLLPDTSASLLTVPEIFALKNENQSLVANKYKTQSQITILESQVSHLQNELSTIRIEQERTNRQISELFQRSRQYQLRHNAMKQSFEIQKSLNTSLGKVHSFELAQVKKKLGDMELRVTEKEDQIQELTKDISITDEKLSKLQTKRQNDLRLMQKMRTVKDEYKSKYEESAKSIEELKRELSLKDYDLKLLSEISLSR